MNRCGNGPETNCHGDINVVSVPFPKTNDVSQQVLDLVSRLSRLKDRKAIGVVDKDAPEQPRI